MPPHLLESRLWLPRPRAEVFAFFAEPENLAVITPPWLGFAVPSAPAPLRAGAVIDYRFRRLGLPLRWRSLIREYDPRSGSWTSRWGAPTRGGSTSTSSARGRRGVGGGPGERLPSRSPMCYRAGVTGRSRRGLAVMGLSLDGPAGPPLGAVRHTVRVALLDGTELRGAVEGFDPRRPTFRLHPTRPGGEPAPRDVVLRHVKKVSFLRDPAAPLPRPAFPLTARLVTVRILDRETIHGVTQGAGGSRGGLFLIPTALDEVERVYVPFSAIRDVVAVERLGEILTQQGAATPAMVQRVLERQRLLRGGHRTPIGQILLGAGALSGPQLAQGLSLRRPGAGRRLGEVLVEQGFISRAQLDEALEVQRRQSAEDTRLGAIMVEMGVVTHKAIGIALAIQYQVPFLDLAGRSIDPGLRELVPAALARRWQIVPVSLEEGILTIALADPTEEAARDEIRAATGLTVTAAVATPPDVAGAIARWYGP